MKNLSVSFNTPDMEVQKISENYEEAVGKFYKYSIFIFKAHGLWVNSPNSRYFMRFIKFLLSALSICLWFVLHDILLFLNIIVHIDDLQLVLSVFFILSTYFSCLIKVFNIRIYNKLFEELGELLHDINFRPTNTYEEAVFSESVAENQRVKKSYTILTVMAASSLIIPALLSGYPNLPFAAYPLLDIAVKNNYIIVFLHQVIGVLVQCTINISFDIIYCSFCIFLSCQLKMFENKLRNIRASNDREVKNQLIFCVKLHWKILHLYECVQKCVMVPLTIQMIASTIVIMTIFVNISTV